MQRHDSLLFDEMLKLAERHAGATMQWGRMAEVGSLSARAKMAINFFVKRVFNISAINASFLCVIANLHT